MEITTSPTKPVAYNGKNIPTINQQPNKAAVSNVNMPGITSGPTSPPARRFNVAAAAAAAAAAK